MSNKPECWYCSGEANLTPAYIETGHNYTIIKRNKEKTTDKKIFICKYCRQMEGID